MNYERERTCEECGETRPAVVFTGTVDADQGVNATPYDHAVCAECLGKATGFMVGAMMAEAAKQR